MYNGGGVRGGEGEQEGREGGESPSTPTPSRISHTHLYRTLAILSSSFTALPSAAYRFLVLRMIRAFPAMTCAAAVRKATLWVSESMSSGILALGSYRRTSQ